MSVLSKYAWVGERFAGVREDRNGEFVDATCPLACHRSANVRLWVCHDGSLGFKCWAGCPKLEILRAVGATWRDCFPGGEMPARPKQEVAGRYPYRDEAGVLLYETVRLEPGWNGRDKDFRQRRPKPGGGWEWKLGDVRRVLYRLPELIAAEPTATVFVVAGEKDCESLARLGLTATTNVCGERSPWLDEYSEYLAGRYVVVIPDADSAGGRHADEVVGSLVRHGAGSVRVAPLPAKDVTAFLTELRVSGVNTPEELVGELWAAVSNEPAWVKEC